MQLIFKLLILNGFYGLFLIEITINIHLKEQYNCNLFKYKGLRGFNL